MQRLPLPLCLLAACLAAGEGSRAQLRARGEIEPYRTLVEALTRIDPTPGTASTGGQTLLPDQLNIDAGGVADLGFDTVPGAVLASPSRNIHLDRWYVIGPFFTPDRLSLRARPDPACDLIAAGSRPDLARGFFDREGEPLRWEFWRGRCLRVEPNRAENGAIYYAWTQVRAAEAGEYWTALGADDFGELWINGELRWKSGREARAYRADEYVAPMRLRRGINDILFRCRNAGGTMGWSVVFLLAQGDGPDPEPPVLLAVGADAKGVLQTRLHPSGMATSTGGRPTLTLEALETELRALRDAERIAGHRPLVLRPADRRPCDVARFALLLETLRAMDLPWHWGQGAVVLAPGEIAPRHHLLTLTPGPAPGRPRIRLAAAGADGVRRACELDRHQLLGFLRACGEGRGLPLLVRAAPSVRLWPVWECCDRAALHAVAPLALGVLEGEDPIDAWLAGRRPDPALLARHCRERATALAAWAAALHELAEGRWAAAQDAQLRDLAATRHLRLGPEPDPTAGPAAALEHMRRSARRAVNAWFDFRVADFATATAVLPAGDCVELVPRFRPEALVEAEDLPPPEDPLARAAAIERKAYALCNWVLHRLRVAAEIAERPDAVPPEDALADPGLDPGWTDYFTAGGDLPAWVRGTPGTGGESDAPEGSPAP